MLKAAIGKNVRDVSGIRFGRLLALSVAGVDPHTNHAVWTCTCDCGNEATVKSSHLLNGSTKSCGCLRRELAPSRPKRSRGGLSRTPEGRAWYSLLHRHPALQIEEPLQSPEAVCPRWRDIASFVADMGPRPSPFHRLARIDRNRGYEPGNCIWRARKQP